MISFDARSSEVQSESERSVKCGCVNECDSQANPFFTSHFAVDQSNSGRLRPRLRLRLLPLDDLERRFPVLKSRLDLRPESVIAQGAPDHSGDIFRRESDPPIGAFIAAIQRHISNRPKRDVRVQPP